MHHTWGFGPRPRRWASERSFKQGVVFTIPLCCSLWRITLLASQWPCIIDFWIITQPPFNASLISGCEVTAETRAAPSQFHVKSQLQKRKKKGFTQGLSYSPQYLPQYFLLQHVNPVNLSLLWSWFRLLTSKPFIAEKLKSLLLLLWYCGERKIGQFLTSTLLLHHWPNQPAWLLPLMMRTLSWTDGCWAVVSRVLTDCGTFWEGLITGRLSTWPVCGSFLPEFGI